MRCGAKLNAVKTRNLRSPSDTLMTALTLDLLTMKTGIGASKHTQHFRLEP
eukprot:m.184312 g.184312  ORF g.184312 m.184312 type:complete len:51 (+) comp16904_c0_seq9:1908-2060(+)